MVVVSKSSGKYREIKCFCTVASEEAAESLHADAQNWINTYSGQQELDFDGSKGRELEESIRVIDNMGAVLINGSNRRIGQSENIFLNSPPKWNNMYLNLEKL